MYYDGIAEGYDRLHSEEQVSKLRIIRDNLDMGNSLVLDVGCGTMLSSSFFSCIGLDPSMGLLKRARGLAINGVAECLPFKDNSFGAVISVTAIHNFENIEKGLKEMKRVGERFVFSVLKRSSRFAEIKGLIEKVFTVQKVIEEDKDTLFFCGL